MRGPVDPCGAASTISVLQFVTVQNSLWINATTQSGIVEICQDAKAISTPPCCQEAPRNLRTLVSVDAADDRRERHLHLRRLKRNWVLVILTVAALVGVALSLALLFEPCKKKSKTNVLNTTETANRTVFENVTSNETIVSTRNETFLFVKSVPVDVVQTLDSSGSLDYDVEWPEENKAARTLMTGLMDNVNTTFKLAMAAWSSIGRVEFGLDTVNKSRVESLPDIQRLPDCLEVEVEDADWTQAMETQNQQCIFASDRDLSKRFARVSSTYYAQALLGCATELEHATNGSWRLCQIITDGALTEDFVGLSYSSEIPGNYSEWDVRFFAEYRNQWVAGGAYQFCKDHDLLSLEGSCTIDDLANYVKNVSGAVIQNIMVGDFNDQDIARIYELSSCSSVDPDCIYVVQVNTFDALTAAAAAISETVSKTVDFETRLVTRAITDEVTKTLYSQQNFTEYTSSNLVSISQDNYCTGDGFSFIFLLLALPLLAYLFFKPIINALERLCTKEVVDDPAPVAMEDNPVFEGQKRSSVDNTLNKKQNHKKKKKHISTFEDEGDEEQTAGSPQEEAGEGEDEAPDSSVPMSRPGQNTAWGNTLADVYDGDDWQEYIADFVVSYWCCFKKQKVVIREKKGDGEVDNEPASTNI